MRRRTDKSDGQASEIEPRERIFSQNGSLELHCEFCLVFSGAVVVHTRHPNIVFQKIKCEIDISSLTTTAGQCVRFSQREKLFSNECARVCVCEWVSECEVKNRCTPRCRCARSRTAYWFIFSVFVIDEWFDNGSGQTNQSQTNRSHRGRALAEP